MTKLLRERHDARMSLCLLRTSLLVAAALGTAACGGDDDEATHDAGEDPIPFEVDQMGPYHPGHRVVDATYTPPGGAPERTIHVHLWYPTEDSDGPHPTYAKLFPDPITIDDASLAPSAYRAGYPVRVHSHGFLGFAGNSADQHRWFASHGWVSVVPEHHQNVLGDAVDPLPTHHYYERPLDVRIALDTLRDLPPTDPLSGKCVTDRVIAAGHSFGTYTMWLLGGVAPDAAGIAAACAAGDVPSGTCTPGEIAAFGEDLDDPRVIAIVPEAGAFSRPWIADSGYAAISKPTLLMTGGDDDVGASNLMPLVPAGFTWLEIAGGCHQVFGLGKCDGIEDAVGFPLVNTYELAFSRYHLLGDRSDETVGLVDGTLSLSNLVTYRRK